MPKKGEIDLRKLRYWKAVLADFEKSGLSGQAYCRKKGIAYTAFANRRRRMSEEGDITEPSTAERISFAPVSVKPTVMQTTQHPSAERLEIVLPRGVMLRVPAGFSAAALADIVIALEV